MNFKAALVVFLSAASGAPGQVRQWTNPGAGDWFVASNWNTGVPAAGESGFINNGGTAQIISGTTPLLQTVYLASVPGSTGFLDVIGGELSTSLVIHVGDHGTGHLNVDNASTIATMHLRFGTNNLLSFGSMTLDDGHIDVAGSIGLGNLGDAAVTHNGGVVDTAVLTIGEGTNASGTWVSNGGEVNISSTLYVGYQGSGSFTQNAPTAVNASTVLMAGHGGSGSYQLNGGTLTATRILRNSTTLGNFSMDGGRLDVDEFGSVTTNFHLTINGGTIAPGDTFTQMTVVRGNFTQNAAAVYELDANLPFLTTQDRLVVFGAVTINDGILDLKINYAPAVGNTFEVINNDGADPVVGTFAGLPEGATFLNAGQLWQITYVGGDGNDVFVTAVEPTCVDPPANMVAWWPFDEHTGSTSEELISGNDGSNVGLPTRNIGEQVQNSLCFNGSAQYVHVPHAPEIDFDMTDFSIDAWVRTTNATGVRVIVDKRASPTSPVGVIGYAMFLSSGQLGCQLADGDGSNSCSCGAAAACTNYVSGPAGFVADGQWHHVAITVARVPGGGTFYVDGVAIGTFDPSCRPLSYANTNFLRIGHLTVGAGSNFEGCIDEVELFDRALAPGEVAAIFDAGSLGKCKCTCPGDVNGDGFRDALDVAAFTRCILLSSMTGDHCACADMNVDEVVDLADIPLFVAELLAGGPCL
ncbi:MAG: hypothetical protein DCC65_15925 [Planctomycetota bacterium]|nr:MAG: hypothetical protein DCC65_15925 [Planctomycetota bacterium]